MVIYQLDYNETKCPKSCLIFQSLITRLFSFLISLSLNPIRKLARLIICIVYLYYTRICVGSQSKIIELGFQNLHQTPQLKCVLSICTLVCLQLALEVFRIEYHVFKSAFYFKHHLFKRKYHKVTKTHVCMIITIKQPFLQCLIKFKIFNYSGLHITYKGKAGQNRCEF